MNDDARCPTCGHLLIKKPRYVVSESELLAILRERDDRQVYRIDHTNKWAVTREKGLEIDGGLVRRLAQTRVLRQSYLGCNDAFGLAPTIDVDASLELRRQTGRRDQIVYAA